MLLGRFEFVVECWEACAGCAEVLVETVLLPAFLPCLLGDGGEDAWNRD